MRLFRFTKAEQQASNRRCLKRAHMTKQWASNREASPEPEGVECGSRVTSPKPEAVELKNPAEA